MLDELDEITKEIYYQYRTALQYLGVDFSSEEIQAAIINCSYGLESAFQAVICYWKYKRQKHEQFYPNSTLIKAINNQWQPIDWKDEYLEDPCFKKSLFNLVGRGRKSFR